MKTETLLRIQAKRRDEGLAAAVELAEELLPTWDRASRLWVCCARLDYEPRRPQRGVKPPKPYVRITKPQEPT